jgi:DnaK suppressor protein
VTPAKKAATPPTKRAAPARKATANARGAAPTPKKSVPKKLSPAGKKPVPTTKNAVPKKAAPTVKKTTPTPRKAEPTVKKVAASATKAAPKKSPVPVNKAVKATTKAAAPIIAKAPAPKKAAPVPKRPTVGPYAKEPKFLEEQRLLLLEERAIYKGQAIDLRAEADSLALEREPGDVQFDEESGEGGTVTVDRERNLALSAQAAAAVEEIDDALRKIDRKTYGGCERCYQPIPKARLRALPFARLCVACKSGGLSRR